MQEISKAIWKLTENYSIENIVTIVLLLSLSIVAILSFITAVKNLLTMSECNSINMLKTTLRPNNEETEKRYYSAKSKFIRHGVSFIAMSLVTIATLIIGVASN